MAAPYATLTAGDRFALPGGIARGVAAERLDSGLLRCPFSNSRIPASRGTVSLSPPPGDRGSSRAANLPLDDAARPFEAEAARGVADGFLLPVLPFRQPDPRRRARSAAPAARCPSPWTSSQLLSWPRPHGHPGRRGACSHLSQLREELRTPAADRGQGFRYVVLLNMHRTPSTAAPMPAARCSCSRSPDGRSSGAAEPLGPTSRAPRRRLRARRSLIMPGAGRPDTIGGRTPAPRARCPSAPWSELALDLIGWDSATRAAQHARRQPDPANRSTDAGRALFVQCRLRSSPTSRRRLRGVADHGDRTGLKGTVATPCRRARSRRSTT